MVEDSRWVTIVSSYKGWHQDLWPASRALWAAEPVAEREPTEFPPGEAATADL